MSPPVRLLTGPSELLLRRAAEQLLDERRQGGALDVVDVRAAEVRTDGLPDLVTSSLFGDPRAVLIREGQELGAAAVAELVAHLERDHAETLVIVLATSTGRIQTLARAVKAADGRVDIAPPRDWEDRKWAALVREEFTRHRRRADDAAVQAILDHAGLDVAAVAEKVAQAVAAPASSTVTADDVERLVTGRGGRGSFAVADAMCDRQPDLALALLRGVLESGDDPVMVLGALTYRVRSLVAVAGKLDPKAVGLSASPGQMRRLHGVRRNFGPGELTSAYRTLAAADRSMKGGELPAELVVERAVLQISTRA